MRDVFEIKNPKKLALQKSPAYPHQLTGGMWENKKDK
jgi:hypothetical protein